MIEGIDKDGGFDPNTPYTTYRRKEIDDLKKAITDILSVGGWSLLEPFS